MDWEESFPAPPGTRAAGSVGGVARPGNYLVREAEQELREGRAVLVDKVVKEVEGEAGETAEVAEGLVGKP
jgi:hypothetical protein